MDKFQDLIPGTKNEISLTRKKPPLYWEVHENYAINENKDRNESARFCRSETSTKQDIQLFHGSQAFGGRLKILHMNKKPPVDLTL